MANKTSKKENFLTLYKKNNGLIGMTCLEIGISKAIFDKWIGEDTVFKDTIDTLNLYFQDKITENLRDKIEKTNDISLIFDWIKINK